MPVTLTEAGTLTRAAAHQGNMLIQLITPGVGSSGVYTDEVLEAAAASRAFPAGTLMFADHPGESESYDRPERSIRDVAGVLVEDARWDGTALVAEARTYSPWTDVLAEMKDAIGVSIRATATVTESDDQGRPVIGTINQGISVDFVTHAGRGGAIREVYESARQRSPLIVRETTPIREATANERDQQLRRLVKDAYGSDNSWSYVLDHDDDRNVVWFSLESGEDSATYQQSYAVSDGVVTALTGDRVEVRRVTTYVPVDPAGQSTTTQESEEDTMPQIEESRLAQLEADAGRVTALESERAQAVQRAEEAERELAEARTATDQATASAIVAEADYPFNDLERAGLMATLPRVAESGRLDVDAFRTRVSEAAAQAAENAGAGRVRGLGARTQSTDSEDLSEAELDAELARISGRTVKEA